MFQKSLGASRAREVNPKTTYTYITKTRCQPPFYHPKRRGAGGHLLGRLIWINRRLWLSQNILHLPPQNEIQNENSKHLSIHPSIKIGLLNIQRYEKVLPNN